MTRKLEIRFFSLSLQEEVSLSLPPWMVTEILPNLFVNENGRVQWKSSYVHNDGRILEAEGRSRSYTFKNPHTSDTFRFSLPFVAWYLQHGRWPRGTVMFYNSDLPTDYRKENMSEYQLTDEAWQRYKLTGSISKVLP